MTWLRVAALRVTGLFRTSRHDRELDEELRTHIEMAVEDNVRRGLSPDEARREAYRRFGGVDETKQLCRERRGLPAIESFARDVRFGARSLVRNRGFAIVAVLTLGIGIGANTAIFSAVNAVLLHPLPYRDAERIVTLWDSSRGGRELGLTDAEFLDIEARNTACDAVAAYVEGAVNLSGDAEPEVVTVTWASAGLFQVFGT